MPQMSPLLWTITTVLLISVLLIFMNLLPSTKAYAQKKNKIFTKMKKIKW